MEWETYATTLFHKFFILTYDVDACVANEIARWQDYLEMIMTSTDLNLMVFLTKIMRQNIVFLYTECYE